MIKICKNKLSRQYTVRTLGFEKQRVSIIKQNATETGKNPVHQ